MYPLIKYPCLLALGLAISPLFAVEPTLEIESLTEDESSLSWTAEESVNYVLRFSTDLSLPITEWESLGNFSNQQGEIKQTFPNSNTNGFYVLEWQEAEEPTSLLGSVTQGRAETTITNLYAAGQRVAGIGTITASDGTSWTVPADTLFQEGPFAPDLYNDDSGVTPASINDVDEDSIPIVEIDPDGEVITGYIFADNYFELYVNGQLVGIDPIPFTQFNSCVVRFRAKAPITYAFKLVDWEENLGLGTEANRGTAYHPGDAGLAASFSDGTVTNGDWKAQTFYISPLDDPEHVTILDDGTRDSSAANDTLGSENSYGMHWAVPDSWSSVGFNDSGWPNAMTYSNATVGVDNKPSYTNFTDQFLGAGAEFIWTSNLVLDNEVIVRYTTE